MGRLYASSNCDWHFHHCSKSRGHILRPANCWELRWVASNDGDCVDLCLGFDHWRDNRSASGCPAYSHRKGVVGAICLEPPFEGEDRGLGEINSASRRARGSHALLTSAAGTRCEDKNERIAAPPRRDMKIAERAEESGYRR